MFLLHENYDEMSKSEESIALEMPTTYSVWRSNVNRAYTHLWFITAFRSIIVVCQDTNFDKYKYRRVPVWHTTHGDNNCKDFWTVIDVQWKFHLKSEPIFVFLYNIIAVMFSLVQHEKEKATHVIALSANFNVELVCGKWQPSTVSFSVCCLPTVWIRI